MAHTAALPNSLAAVRERVAAKGVSQLAPWAMLFARLVLFAVWQAVIAVLFVVLGEADPWDASVAWWPAGATLANLTNLALLGRLARAEGLRLRDLYGFNRPTWKTDVRWTAAATVAFAALVMLPNTAVAIMLWGDPAAATPTMFQSLPMWAIVPLMVVFPLTIALTEMPTYYGYVMPRLQASTGSRWGIVVLVASMHAAQHMTLPLVFDARFIAWRLLMFWPFALFVAWALDRRPTLMPYMMVVHGLLDASVVIMVLLTTLGNPDRLTTPARSLRRARATHVCLRTFEGLQIGAMCYTLHST